MRLGVCGGEEVTFSVLDANFKLQALETDDDDDSNEDDYSDYWGGYE